MKVDLRFCTISFLQGDFATPEMQVWLRAWLSYIEIKKVIFVSNVASYITFLRSVSRSPFGAIFLAMGEVCLMFKISQI